MLENTLTIITFIFTRIWKLFSGWYIPGTNVTPANLFLLIIFAAIVIRFVKRILADNWHNNKKGEE